MSDFADLIAAIVVLAGVVAVFVGLRFWNRQQVERSKSKLNGYDYVVFEADPADLALLKSDLSGNGWELADASRTEGAAWHYRFEKAARNATGLGDVCLDFGTYMPRTANRTTETVIKIKDHGLKRLANA